MCKEIQLPLGVLIAITPPRINSAISHLKSRLLTIKQTLNTSHCTCAEVSLTFASTLPRQRSLLQIIIMIMRKRKLCLESVLHRVGCVTPSIVDLEPSVSMTSRV